MFRFKKMYQDAFTKARVGELQTDHGVIPTPIFMPVGTVGNVKAVHIRDLKSDINAKIILGNTYHLYLRPGLEILEACGGLHKFNGWDRPILTDSGGYQVYSLAQIRKITEEGVKFQSHIDGSYHFFTPERVMDIERSIGADIIMAFDECTPFPCEYSYAKKSLALTNKWLARCMERYRTTEPLYGYHQELFPIVQGSVYKDLRREAAEYVSEFGAGGNAIGGLAVGEPAETMYELTEWVCDILPPDKPRYLMGVGTPENILESIALGVDMFDCVMPTRNGRNGMLFTNYGIINIKNKKWEKDFSPIDNLCPSFVSNSYTKAYLRHLFAAREILGGMIASQHNLAFYLQLVEQAREQIMLGTYKKWKDEKIKIIMQRL
ncbi:MAG: tRNA guanosine(34) transglycosylase Tgt [Bacteroidales bacterium]|jgi:queuine tRNA-ribosyltransferase|nr:tRNA guanosine(34) transglycosylase Tgt [Bacteroidales bacterium]MDD2205560.1 tRNA guanosine(34) transglycosylase Tgt [Bacteroidales bacterium]MDD3152287.1 tRNA guanosine(34) transglycosylase Tgt [Bacteroidales bacterium]MDD3914946.1 tRNA guanosine(34) transglycosylase Tgt [Bacteroidales bacterium]MDD4634820.1 tRNA guanosine(34) transglycosylase Tgt [Bacteroidales bacterium]